MSRDSTYRTSIAPTVESAITKGNVLATQGADFIDLGAESTTASAKRVFAENQIDSLTPVVEQLAKDGILVSVEAYDVAVARRGLEAGASIINLTGQDADEEMFRLLADFDAAVIMSFTRGKTVKDHSTAPTGDDAYVEIVESLARRVDLARSRGCTKIIVDPGLGFYYSNLTDPKLRADHQARMLLTSFRMSSLGLPICQSLPHAFDYFGEEYRTAESFYATLAIFGGAHLLRTHEVAKVKPIVTALAAL